MSYKSGIVAAVFAAALSASEGPALVRDGRVTTVQTFNGVVGAKLAPVTSARVLTVLVLSDTIGDADVVRLRREMAAALPTSFLGTHPLQLVMLSGSGGDFSTPLTNAEQLAALAKQLTAGKRAVDPLMLIEMLGTVATNLPGGWAHTVIVGRLPVFAKDENFVAAWLGETCRKQRARVSFWSLDGGAPAWAQNVAGGSMGMVATGAFNALMPMLKDNSPLFEANWETKPAKGAVAYTAQFKNETGDPTGSLVSLASAAGYTLPFRAYLTARAPDMTDDVAQQVLALNPADADALRHIAAKLTAQNNLKEAAEMWRSLNEVSPLDGFGWVAIGKANFAAGEFAEAEKAFGRAAELGVKDGDSLAAQAQIHLKRNDFEGALPLLEEALKLDPKSQRLWLLRADCAKSLKRSPLEIDSLEHALAAGDLPQDRSHDLIAQYLSNGQLANALKELQRTKSNTPADSAGLMEYAAFWERVKQPAEAEGLWLKAIKMEPKAEPAYTALVADYSAAGRTADAARIAEQGLIVLPASPPLLLAKEKALEQSDRYQARRFLAGLRTQNLDLLKRRAVLEDMYGGQGAAAYTALVKGMVEQSAPQVDVVEACRRGLLVALREENYEAANSFAEKLSAAGDRSGRELLTTTGKGEARANLPGGADAFHFLLFSHGKGDRARIMLDAAREFAQIEVNSNERKATLHHIAADYHEYFQRVANLIDLGERKGNVYVVQLSVADKAARHRTEKAFEILGLKLHRDKEGVDVKSAEGKNQQKKQDTLAALEIDEQGIEDALGQGKRFPLEIPYEEVSVFPAEEEWRKTFYANEKLPGGLAEALASDQKVARLYFGLNSMDRTAASALLRAMPLKDLAEHFSTQLWLYSAALAFNGAAAEVPGGTAARATWASLAGSDPANGSGFLLALMRRDQGRLMAFFYTLSQLDMEHQRFFMRSGERAKRFYELFRESAEMRHGGDVRAGESDFVQFLREVPLNDDLTVDFPGSPEVWMVAKGLKNTSGSVEKLTRQMKQTAAPDDEDQILIRLAGAAYKSGGRAHSELANFVAVTRIDAERKNPLPPESALVLAQGYLTHIGLYPFMTELGDLELADYRQLLSLDAKFEGIDVVHANLRMGLFQAFLSVACATRQSGFLNDQNFLVFFRQGVARIAAAASSADWSNALLSSVSDLTRLLGETSADAALRKVLLAGASPQRQKVFNQVLDLQKVPPLDALLAVKKGSEKNPLSQQDFDVMDKALQQLAMVSTPKGWHLIADRKRLLDSFDSTEALNLVSHMRQRAAKNRMDPKDAPKLMTELEPWVELALVGRVYARYLDPSDLLVSEDPVLLRKHEFVYLGPRTTKQEFFQRADTWISSGDQGSYFVGGLADFVLAAGHARSAGNHLGGDGGEWFAAALIASVRGTNWQELNTTTLSSFAANVRLAREWIVESASSPDLLTQLENESRGVLSLVRMRTMIDALRRRDWPVVWGAVTASDLHFIGDELSEHAPEALWKTPQLKAMKTAAQHELEAGLLGQVAPDLDGTAQPRLRRFEPYEEYLTHEAPKFLSQRLAELKMNLAWLADGAAWEPQRLVQIAEPAADELLVKLKMHDLWDWTAPLEAYRSLKADDMQQLAGHK